MLKFYITVSRWTLDGIDLLLKYMVIFFFAALAASMMTHHLKCPSDLGQLIFKKLPLLKQIVQLPNDSGWSHLQAGGKTCDRVPEAHQDTSSLNLKLLILQIAFLVSALNE